MIGGKLAALGPTASFWNLTGGNNDIRLEYNQCGCVYEMPLTSTYDGKEIIPLLCGSTTGADTNNRCSINGCPPRPPPPHAPRCLSVARLPRINSSSLPSLLVPTFCKLSLFAFALPSATASCANRHFLRPHHHSIASPDNLELLEYGSTEALVIGEDTSARPARLSILAEPACFGACNSPAGRWRQLLWAPTLLPYLRLRYDNEEVFEVRVFFIVVWCLHPRS